MEFILPQEVICEILFFVRNVDIFRYSLCSRISRQTAEKVWKLKVINLFGGSTTYHQKLIKDGKISSPDTKWVYEIHSCSFHKVFVTEKQLRIKSALKRLYMHAVDEASTKEEKIQAIYNLNEFVISNLDIIRGLKTFKNFYVVLEERLFELCKNEDFKKGEHYFSILFPETYEERFYPWSNQLQKLYL